MPYDVCQRLILGILVIRTMPPIGWIGRSGESDEIGYLPARVSFVSARDKYRQKCPENETGRHKNLCHLGATIAPNLATFRFWIAIDFVKEGGSMKDSEIMANTAKFVGTDGTVSHELLVGPVDAGAERFSAVVRPPASSSEETVVVDDRSGLSPAQVVETKLSRILEGSSLPVSHLQMRGILRNR